jgi:hypothetical protein
MHAGEAGTYDNQQQRFIICDMNSEIFVFVDYMLENI